MTKKTSKIITWLIVFYIGLKSMPPILWLDNVEAYYRKDLDNFTKKESLTKPSRKDK